MSAGGHGVQKRYVLGERIGESHDHCHALRCVGSCRRHRISPPDGPWARRARARADEQVIDHIRCWIFGGFPASPHRRHLYRRGDSPDNRCEQGVPRRSRNRRRFRRKGLMTSSVLDNAVFDHSLIQIISWFPRFIRGDLVRIGWHAPFTGLAGFTPTCGRPAKPAATGISCRADPRLNRG
jgi:hypothetical protein